MSQKFLAVITRCRDEFFIKEFCDYYLSQGVDGIYLIDDDSEDKSIYDFLCLRNKYKEVNIIFSPRRYDIPSDKQHQLCFKAKDIPNKIYAGIRNLYEWLIYVDVDEFIVTKKNPTNTIADELAAVPPDIDYIAAPWVLMSGRKLKNNPKSILREVLFRHDHNKKHPSSTRKFRCRFSKIETKAIFRTKKFKRVTDHYPVLAKNEGPTTRVNGIDLCPKRVVGDGKLMNLREEDISTGFFLCYHYRFISEENAINKLKTNGWYIRDGYTVDDLLSSSYPEIYDDTLLIKLEKAS